jgi:hypothetical protein
MDSVDHNLTNLAVDTAVFVLSNWKDGRGTVDAQAIHHILSLLAGLRIPVTDPLLDDIESQVSLSSDSEPDFGLYLLGLARLGAVNCARIDEAFIRLRMTRAELAMKRRNTPFGRYLLERLTMCEGLALRKEQLTQGQVSELLVSNRIN